MQRASCLAAKEASEYDMYLGVVKSSVQNMQNGIKLPWLGATGLNLVLWY